MSKRIKAKDKVARQEGCNLWGRAGSSYNARAYRPGQHGQRRAKVSDYGAHLRAKQRLKRYYNMQEKQFFNLFSEAERRKGDTGENFVNLLERRLIAVVYRAKFAPTIFSARQIVSHGHILVNGKRVNIPSYLVKDGDVIEMRSKARELPLVLQAVQSQERDVPDYLEVDHKKMTATFVRGPGLADVPYPVQMEPNLIVEYYSQ